MLCGDRRARSGRAGRIEAGAGAPRRQADRRQGGVAALRRPHAVGGEALQQLDMLIAFGERVFDIVDLQVLVKIDEILRDTNLPPATVWMILLELELAGRLERQPGGQVALLL